MATHYETLGLRPDATPHDIRRAAEAIRRTFQRDEMAVYSLMESEDERLSFLTEIETAARVLLDRAGREQYDAMMLIEPRYVFTDADMIAPIAVPAGGSFAAESRSMVLPLDRSAGVSSPTGAESRGSVATQQASVVDSQEPTSVASPLVLSDLPSIDGAVLARLRTQSGLAPEHVVAQLKISMTQLLAIENMDHSRLPEAVYVKGFVKGYARLLKLDPERTSTEYMQAFKSAKPT